MNDEESKGEDKEDFFQVEKIVDMKSVKGKLIILPMTSLVNSKVYL